MPIIKFKDKKPDAKKNTAAPVAIDDDYMRNISMPVNDDILETAEIDQQVVVTIIGTVTGVRSHVSEGYTDKNITVRASSIEVYERDDDDEEAGMKAGYRRS